MFHSRSEEMARLTQLYKSGAFEFAVLYGRRRVGKTTLIKEFIKDKKAIFFAASESTADDNLLSLSRCIYGKNDAPVFRDFDSALSEVFAMARDERLVFVIDEFPYLADAYKGISSLLQIQIDHKKQDSKLMLILCGSSMSFMENQVLGYKSPLYGRRTAQFKILPFTFFESLPFFAGFCAEDKAVLYGVTGGIPEYLNKIDGQKSVRDNITDLFLTPSGHFFEEPTNLIKQELREPATYNTIIQAIASGASRLNEIATKSKLESNKCAKYLSSLISLGLVSKEYPYGETGGKRSIYKLEDKMFRFWYRFVFPNLSAIIAGLGEGVYKNIVAEQLNAYMGLIFEDICKQWFFEQAKKEALPFFIGSLGRWWGTPRQSRCREAAGRPASTRSVREGTNPETRTQEEIDIMAVFKDNVIIAECKWSSADGEVFHDLQRKGGIFAYENKYFYVFAKSFTCPAPKNVKIYALDDIIE